MGWVLWVLGLVVVLFVLDRLALWAESRGWIYWRRSPPSGSAAGNALMSVAGIFEPGKQHAVEEQQRAEVAGDRDEDDEPLPDP